MSSDLEGPEYRGSFGRTLFDERASQDGSVTVVFPADRIGDIPSQSLIHIISVPDRHEYIASLTSGPFCEPDGLTAQSRDAPTLNTGGGLWITSVERSSPTAPISRE